MFEVDLIAKWFIARNKCDNDLEISDEPISNLKLQKLLYYAQGCTLALKDTPLFNDDFEAWEHGPAIPKVYNKYFQVETNGIVFDEIIEDLDLVNQKTFNILENVYITFSQYSAWKLCEMSRQETPWLTTNKNDIIPKDCIKKYFKENYIE